MQVFKFLVSTYLRFLEIFHQLSNYRRVVKVFFFSLMNMPPVKNHVVTIMDCTVNVGPFDVETKFDRNRNDHMVQFV